MILTGIIRDIFPEKTISSNFRFTEIWLLEANTKHGQCWSLQFWNDDAKALRGFQTGMLVNVNFAPIGRLTEKNGKETVYTNLRALKITKISNG